MKKIGILILLVTSWLSHSIYAADKATKIFVSAEHPVFTLKLNSNPTTGYSWSLQKYDEKFLIPSNHHFQVANTGLMGAPGMEIWTFKVKPSAFIKPQHIMLQMMYARPWRGGGVASVRTFQVITKSSTAQ